MIDDSKIIFKDAEQSYAWMQCLIASTGQPEAWAPTAADAYYKEWFKRRYNREYKET